MTAPSTSTFTAPGRPRCVPRRSGTPSGTLAPGFARLSSNGGCAWCCCPAAVDSPGLAIVRGRFRQNEGMRLPQARENSRAYGVQSRSSARRNRACPRLGLLAGKDRNLTRLPPLLPALGGARLKRRRDCGNGPSFRSAGVHLRISILTTQGEMRAPRRAREGTSQLLAARGISTPTQRLEPRPSMARGAERIFARAPGRRRPE